MMRSYDSAPRPPPHPPPHSCHQMSLFLSFLVCRRSRLLTGGWGGGGEKPKWMRKPDPLQIIQYSLGKGAVPQDFSLHRDTAHVMYHEWTTVAWDDCSYSFFVVQIVEHCDYWEWKCAQCGGRRCHRGLQHASPSRPRLLKTQRKVRKSLSMARREWLRKVHSNENPIYVFPEKELRGLSPNSHIHVPVSDLQCMFPGSVHVFSCSRIGRPIVGLY